MTIMTLSGGTFRRVKDKGDWSIRTDYCEYCMGMNAPTHPYNSVPLRKGLDIRGNADDWKVCEEHLPRFTRNQERYAKARERRAR